MNIDNKIKAFIRLGNFLAQFGSSSQKTIVEAELNEKFYSDFQELITLVQIRNPWFTERNVRLALTAISSALKEECLVDFISNYISELKNKKESKIIAVIMAGNIPLVAFHDWMCVLLSGNKFLGKLSSDDNLLLPFISKILIEIESGFEKNIEFTDGQLKEMDAVIATGSDNSARYFEYYFGKYPHIIRKNRNSVAVLDGTESTADLKQLGNDIFQYFGLGCRNVSKLFVPKSYVFNLFFESIIDFNEVTNHNKYANNYEYNRTVYLMSPNPSLLDNNFLLLKEDTSYSSPIGVLFYEFYESIEQLNKKLISEKEKIQCIISNNKAIENAIAPGQAQYPSLKEYADGEDTMKFLLSL